jgi:hypothetical protein
MLSEGKKSVNGFIRRNKILTIGIIAIVAGISMVSAARGVWDTMNHCTDRPVTIDGKSYNAFPPGGGSFDPGATFTAVCLYDREIGQDLIFWATIHVDAYSTAIPTHLEITDPDGNVVAAREFDSSRVVLNIGPEKFGNYTATITNTQDPADRIATRGVGYTIAYAFGHLTSGFSGVSNPAGDVIGAMVWWGYRIIIPGFIMVAYSVARMVYKATRKSLPRVR